MISHKKIAIFGLGKEGVSAANFLGNQNEIFIFDQKLKDQIDKVFFKKLKVKPHFFFKNSVSINTKFDYVIRSPGVRPDNPDLLKLISKDTILTSTTKIFFELCPAKIIGVTGTKGKGTTSTLVYEMIKTQNNNVYLAGNIGTPSLDILPKLNQESLVVLELSSFQLFDLDRSPQIAVVLMITQEHLDWHKDVFEYQKSKQSIVAFQNSQNYAVINYDFAASNSFAKLTKAAVYFVSTRKSSNGVFIQKEQVISEINGREKICATAEIILPGYHNLQNIVAAIAVAKILKIKNQNIAKILRSFKGLKHRLQLVKITDGVKYYNDSFSTIPETTIAAIEAFKQPIILILGGSSKNSNFKDLGRKIAKSSNIKALILIGKEAKRIAEIIEKAGGFRGTIIRNMKNMQEIVTTTRKISAIGDIVILSPACASFDMFKNYQDRGEQFIREVKNLK